MSDWNNAGATSGIQAMDPSKQRLSATSKDELAAFKVTTNQSAGFGQILPQVQGRRFRTLDSSQRSPAWLSLETLKTHRLFRLE